MPQFSSGNLTVFQMNIILNKRRKMSLLIESAYMLYDAKNPPPQIRQKIKIDYTKEKKVELLLDSDANIHHEAWGSLDVNPRGKQLHDFLCGTRVHILNKEIEPIFMNCKKEK